MCNLGRVVEIRGGGLILEGGEGEKYLTNASDLSDCQPLKSASRTYLVVWFYNIYPIYCKLLKLYPDNKIDR